MSMRGGHINHLLSRRLERKLKWGAKLTLCLLLAGLIGALPSGPRSAQAGWFWQNPLPQGNSLGAVAMVDANTVTAVGEVGTILRTDDAGVTWTLQSSGTTQNLKGVAFTDTNTGTAVGGGGTILRTLNGGRTWITEPSG